MFKKNRSAIAARVRRLRRASQVATVIAIMSLGLGSACRSTSQRHIVTPQGAVAIAKNSWSSVYDKTHSPTYSKAETARFEPYTATLKDGIWTVQGTIPPGYRGETLVTTVRAADGFASIAAVEVR
jgi:hypothetical protein